MARPSFRLNSLPVAGLSLAAVGLLAAAYSFGGSDAVVERGFERAFASLDGLATQTKGADLITTTGLQLRISRVAHDGARDAAKAFAKPVAIGDRITIASGGRERALHVVKVDQLDSSIVPASSANPAPLLLVTCSDDSNPKARPVRFLIEADETLPTLSVTAAARTL
jgi:hypothetical protein